MSVLSCNKLRRTFYVGKGLLKRKLPLHAVNGVTLTIERGETLAVVGESGCGKTTLAKMLLGMLPPSTGDISFGSLAIGAISRRQLARRIQPVFQDPYSSLNPRKTVFQIIALPLVVHGECNASERRQRVEMYMDLVGLSRRLLHSYPVQLSGGQRQRVAIARALVIRPDIVVCDEPTSALDVSVQAQILNLLLDLRRELGLTLVLISHDLAVVEHMANRIAVMYLGRVVEEGTAEQVFDRPRHPYTKALLGSVLTPEPELGLPEVVLGATFPNPVEPPAGCVFHPRCPEFIEGTCDAAEPALLPVDDNVRVRCFRTESGPSS